MGRLAKNISSPFLRVAALCISAATFSSAQTPYFLSGGNFSENFDDIADTTAWPNGFLNSEPWAAVAATTATTPIPAPTTITASSQTISAGDSFTAGIQRGAGNLYLLSNGGGTGNTSSTAVDLLLSFTNRNAGTFSFDASTVFNGALTSNRDGTLRLYYTTDNTTWVEVTTGGLPFTATNYVAASQAVNVNLPATLNEAATVRFRFYYHNSTSIASSPSGSRPKISIDNIAVSSTAAGPDTVAPTLTSLSPANGANGASISGPLRITFSEPVIAGSGNVTLYAGSSPSTPIQTFAASSGSFQNSSVTFTPASALAYDTDYFVNVDASAFQDAAMNSYAGISTSSDWAFRTEVEPPPVAPMVVSVTPESNGTAVIAGPTALSAVYDTALVAGVGSLVVYDLNDFNNDSAIATYNVANPAEVTITGSTVTFTPSFTAVAGVTYKVIAPAGMFRNAVSNTNAQGFGFGPGDFIWFFEVKAPDTSAPVLVSTSPQNGPGASVSKTLTANFDENVTLGSGPWTITVTDVTAAQQLAAFTEANTSEVSALGTALSISLPANLAFNNEYRVELSAGVVMDAAGNPSGAINGDAWKFTTGDPFQPGKIVISQVYGGGGNSGATLTNDFVELHNRTTSPISVSGWSVQYTSRSGTTWAVTNLSGVIQPGGYYLVEEGKGSGGTQALPTPDATGNISMGASDGKVALSSSNAPLTGGNPSNDPAVSDFVGLGTADASEGTGTALGAGNDMAVIRRVAGSQDTNDNRADFTAGTPSPRNSASPTFFPVVDGSGTAIATNFTSGTGSLIGSKIFRSAATAQSVKIDLTGSLAGSEIKSVEIDVPADFGTPSSGNVTATGGGTVAVNNQKITISGVAITPSTTLTVTIAGLTAPNVSTDLADNGKRTFVLRTAGNGGTPAPVLSSPIVRVVVPVADLGTLRAVVLPSPKAYLLNSEAIVTYLADGNFRNQHWIQDSTGGILIDDQTLILAKTFAVGDGIGNLVGELTAFAGLLEIQPIAATAVATSVGNIPLPIDLTLSQLSASPLIYQSRLVRVSGVTFDPATGDFVNNTEYVLKQGTANFGFSPFFNADYIGTPVPTSSKTIVGLVRRLNNTMDFLSPRSLADITDSNVAPGPGYAGFSDQLAGGQGPTLDFDNDGVPNGVEYFFGVKTAGFTPTPTIVNGAITFPRDPAATDVTYAVQTSPNLEIWTDVPQGNLDLSNPNAVRYVVPSAPGPFFVRIKVVVTPPAP